MSVVRSEFGKSPYGEDVEVFTLTNATEMRVRVMTHGATILSIDAPDRDGKMADVVLGFDTAAEYGPGTPYFGSLVGRFGNRIADGQFTLDGTDYQIHLDKGETHALHGGVRGFDQRNWTADVLEAENAVRMRYLSPDGEEGFPGNLEVLVVYTLTDANELIMDYTATADRATPVNVTNHSYFNLAGHDAGSQADHLMTIFADTFVVTDAEAIPTGELRPVAGSPMDFRTPAPIGSRIDDVYDPLSSLEQPGYDFTYCINRAVDGELVLAARAEDPVSGRVLETWTTEPGVQFYTGNYLDGTTRGKGGCLYAHRGGFCLETQHYPDSPHRPEFPSTILRPGEILRSQTMYKFI